MRSTQRVQSRSVVPQRRSAGRIPVRRSTDPKRYALPDLGTFDPLPARAAINRISSPNDPGLIDALNAVELSDADRLTAINWSVGRELNEMALWTGCADRRWSMVIPDVETYQRWMLTLTGWLKRSVTRVPVKLERVSYLQTLVEPLQSGWRFKLTEMRDRGEDISAYGLSKQIHRNALKVVKRLRIELDRDPSLEFLIYALKDVDPIKIKFFDRMWNAHFLFSISDYAELAKITSRLAERPRFEKQRYGFLNAMRPYFMNGNPARVLPEYAQKYATATHPAQQWLALYEQLRDLFYSHLASGK